VQFARAAGTIMSAVGENRYEVGDALVTGSTGDSWSVSRDRFTAKYEALNSAEGEDGQYRAKPVAVLAVQIDTAFEIARSAGADMLIGEAGDWLLQYSPGDYGVVANARFQRVYRPATI
jgi:PGDYG protein